MGWSRFVCAKGMAGQMMYAGLLTIIVWSAGIGDVAAKDVRVAVASNFVAPFRDIAAAFQKIHGHKVVIIPGSSGKLYAQIHHGAPFDAFFSADIQRPALLEEEGLAVKGSRFTYAVGRLTLWSADPSLVKERGEKSLAAGHYTYLAIANPKTAPYGRAAVQILQALQVWDEVQPRLVLGENIGQTFQFVVSRNAQLGFVALSQVLDRQLRVGGSRWDVPPALHDPLDQQAVLLTKGQKNEAAVALLHFVKHEHTVKAVLQQFGYGLPGASDGTMP